MIFALEKTDLRATKKVEDYMSWVWEKVDKIDDSGPLTERENS